jgi:hypothetical protein
MPPQAPPMPYVPAPPRRRLLGPLVILIVVMVVLAAFAVVMVVWVGSTDNATPEDAVRDFWGGLSDKNPSAMFNETVFQFNSSTYSDWLAATGYGYISMVDFQVTVNSVDAIYPDEMTSSQLSELQHGVRALEVYMGKNITEYCLVEANVTLKMYFLGQWINQTANDTMPCVKIGSKWYIVEPTDMVPGWQLVTAYVSLSRTSISYGSKITIGYISDATSWSDVRIGLMDSYSWVYWYPTTADLTGTPPAGHSYGSQTLGSLSVTLNVTDVAGNGWVDMGDYITIQAPPSGFDYYTYYTLELTFEPLMGSMGDVWFSG